MKKKFLTTFLSKLTQSSIASIAEEPASGSSPPADKAAKVGGNQLVSSSAEVNAFLTKVASLPKGSGDGRLLFALDATASRQATWDSASHLQAQMFGEAAALGYVFLPGRGAGLLDRPADCHVGHVQERGIDGVDAELDPVDGEARRVRG